MEGNYKKWLNRINAKLNKPTTTGNTTSYPYVVGEDGNGNSARLPAGDLGKNFFNSDLSNTTARNHTMKAAVTINTLGNPYYWKGLSDKTNNTNYSKKLALNPTTGEIVVKDNADPTDVTNAINNATATQKTSMRTALFGTATPASPVINNVNSYFIKRGQTTILFLTGINLTPLNPVSIWIEDGSGNKVFAENYYAISGTVLQTTWTIPLSFPTGEYSVKIANGGVPQGASPGKMLVVNESTNTLITLNSSNLIIKSRSGYTVNANTTGISSDNIITLAKLTTSYPASTVDNSYDVAIKTSNIFLGNINSSWEIILNTTSLIGSGVSGDKVPYIVLTETDDVTFSSPDSIVQNVLLFTSIGHSVFVHTSGNNGTSYYNADYIAVIKKTGNKIATFFRHTITNDTMGYMEQTIDTSKNYAIAFLEARTSAGQYRRQMTITTNILN